MSVDDQHSRLIALPPGIGGRAPSLRETLEHQVQSCLDAPQHARHDIAVLLRGHALGKGSDKEVFGAGLTLDTARHLVAREHEFRDWTDAIVRGDEPVDPTFEAAVDAVPAAHRHVTSERQTIKSLPRRVSQLQTNRGLESARQRARQ